MPLACFIVKPYVFILFGSSYCKTNVFNRFWVAYSETIASSFILVDSNAKCKTIVFYFILFLDLYFKSHSFSSCLDCFIVAHTWSKLVLRQFIETPIYFDCLWIVFIETPMFVQHFWIAIV